MAISYWILCVATIGGRPDWLGPLSRREGSAPRGAGMGNGPHPLCPRGPRAYFDGPYGGLCSDARAPKTPHGAFKISQCDAAPLFATRRATSLQTHPRQPLMGRGRGREGMETHGVATGDGRRAGKSSRKPRRPRPYSRHLRGYHCDPNVVPLPPPCAYRTPRMPST